MMYSKSINVLLLLLLLSSHHHLSSAKPSASFLEAECRAATLYPSLCIQSLSNYSKVTLQSPEQLARAALTVGLRRVQSALSFISKAALMRGLKPAESRAVRDCSANMACAVDQLSRSLKELGGVVGGPPRGMRWHRSNVVSWVGAAITFEQTCLDGLESPMMDGSVKVVVKERVTDCKKVTSNALAFIHRYAAAKLP